MKPKPTPTAPDKQPDPVVDGSPSTKDTQTVVNEIPTNLDLDDIAKLIKVIDIATEKGIFKPADFISIGQTYSKLVQIIKANTLVK